MVDLTLKEEQAPQYLEKIRQHPNENALRFKYAEWLSQRGDPRGKFIRLQLNIIQQRKAGSTKWFDTYEKAEHLEKKHRQEWLEADGVLESPAWAAVDDFCFYRGMIEEVTVDASKFLQHA